MKFDVLFQDINVSLHNLTTKKAWRKSLRHAPIKENLIVKIEISDSNSYSGTLPQPHPEEAVVDDISSIVLVDILY